MTIIYKMPKNLNPDLRFLIACCQSNPSEADTAFILSHLSQSESSSSSPNPEPRTLNPLIALANQHGVLPLVYKTLKKQLKNQTIQNLTFNIEDWQAAYQQIAQRNMLMSAELIRIMKLLEENNIQALAFKGPTLAQMTYGDITLRQYGDLDILVNEKDVYKTAQLLLNKNYEPMNSIEFLKNTAKLHVEKNYEFYDRNNGIKVEVHWKLINTSFLKKFKDYNVFSKHNKIFINNKPLPTLDSEILLLYLCNHGASHMWERLEWILDIDKLIKSEDFSPSWNEMITLASSLQSKTTLLLGLGLSRAFFHTKLSPEIKSELNNPKILKLISLVINTFHCNLISKDHTSHEKNLTIFKFNLALQDSLFMKVGFILHTFFDYSDRDIMMINLPKPLFFLYYPLRLLRIIYKYTVNIVLSKITKMNER